MTSLKGHPSLVMEIVFSPDCQFLACVSIDKVVRFWDLKTKEKIRKIDNEEPAEELPLSSDGSYPKTSQGISNPKHVTQLCQSNCPSPLYVSGNWVTWGMENILWLPPEYRPNCLAVRHNVLALGYKTGQVIFIEFDLDAIPLSELFRIWLTAGPNIQTAPAR